MRFKSARVLFVLLVLLGLTGAIIEAFAQASKSGQQAKAPAVAPQQRKKPNVVVFSLQGTPAPAQRPQRPKDIPRYRPLSSEEKLKIVQGIEGLPHTLTAAPPYLTLSTIHIIDPLGMLLLNWPNYASPVYTDYADFPSSDKDDAKAFNAKYVQAFFQADPGNVYLVDFVIYLGPVQGTPEFQLTVQGMTPFSQPAQPNNFNDLVAPVYNIPSSGWYSVSLQVQPPPPGADGGNYYTPWLFERAEVTKYVPSS
jgi:hypothetical protein